MVDGVSGIQSGAVARLAEPSLRRQDNEASRQALDQPTDTPVQRTAEELVKPAEAVNQGAGAGPQPGHVPGEQVGTLLDILV